MGGAGTTDHGPRRPSVGAAMTEQADKPTETAPAAEAFRDYVALGPKRSLRLLAKIYAERERYKTATTAFSVLSRWSALFRWQERLAAATSAHIDAILAEAGEVDAKTFLRTSELLAERVAMSQPLDADFLVKVRESVRKPAPRGAGGVDVTVKVTLALQELAERAAAEEGFDPADVIAEAEAFLAGSR